MNDSPEQTYNRLQGEIQRAILDDFPNPERKGCPGDDVVRRLATNPGIIRVDDELDETSNWYHVTHCSPCYALFLEARDAERNQVRSRQNFTRRTILVTSLAVVAGGIGWLLMRREIVDVDLGAQLIMQSQLEPSLTHLRLPSGRVTMRLRLPAGSSGGLYDVDVRRLASDDTLFSNKVSTTDSHGFQILRFDVVLPRSSSVHTFAIRPAGNNEWTHYYFRTK